MLTMIHEEPSATAEIRGRKDYDTIRGKVDFYDTYEGTILVVEIYGIPGELEAQSKGFHGFHIHGGASCTGNKEDAFADAGTHYDKGRRRHPGHSGDLPPVLSNNGVVWAAIYTSRFYPEDVIGKTVILHEKADDFRSQPSGDSKEKIACGEIRAWEDGSRG